jgi:competence protein ComEC
VEVVAQGKGNGLVAFLFTFKKAMTDKVSRILPEPEAGLLDGLIFGAKRALGADVLDMFRVAGIVHIVVLSGYNITIIADFLTRAFLFLPLSKMAASFLGGTGIALFAVMTGLGTSTLRAVIMALLAIFARVTGRTADALHLLFVAAFFMVLWNPLSLLHDPSFQLSFLATLGLILLGPELARRFLFVPTKWGIRETFSATLSTQIFVLPLLLYETGMLSLVALPVNLMILPMIPFAMFFGSVAVLLGFITPFGTFFSFPVFLILSLVFVVASFFADLPFSSVSVPQFPAIILAAVYLSYILIYFVCRGKETQANNLP